jgi:hypothetical protein
MANEQDKTKVLYDAVSKDYNIGTFDEFKSKLQDENKRKAFYNGVGKEYGLGTYDEFSAKVSPVKKKEPAQPSTGSLESSRFLQEKPTPTTTIPYRPGAKERLDVQKELEPQIKKQKEVIRVTELLQKPLPYQQQNLPDFNLNKPIKNPIELKVNKINNGIELNKLRALEGKKNFLDKRTELDVEMSKLQSLKNDYDKADNDVTREGLFKQYNIALESAKAKEAELSQLKTEIDNTEITAKKLEKGLVAIKSMSDEKNSALVNSMNNFYNNTIPSLAKGIGYTIGAAADLAQMGGAGNLPATTTDSKTAGDYVRQFSDRLTDEMFANVDDEFKNKSIFDKDENGEYSNLKSPTAWANFITATSGQLLTTAIGGGLGGSTVARATGMFTAMPDIYEGAKEAGLNNQEAALFSIPVALTVGAFEEGGAAPFIVKSAKKAFSKQLGVEMASKVAGKEVTPELIQKVFGEAYQTALDKTTSKFGNIITDALLEAGGEAAEQALQGLAEMGYDATFGKGKERGKGAFGTTFKDVIVQSGEAGVGGFVAATPFSSIKNLSTSQKTEFVNLVKDASNDKEVYNSVIEGLDELKANNEINQGQYNQYVKRFNDMVSLNTKIPPAIDGEARLDAMELVKRKDELVEQKKVVDSSFYEQIDNQISDIDTKLKELATQPTKPVTPPTAEVTLPEVEVVAEKPALTEPIEAQKVEVKEEPKEVVTEEAAPEAKPVEEVVAVEKPITETTYNFEKDKPENAAKFDYYTREEDGITKYFKKEKQVAEEAVPEVEKKKTTKVSDFLRKNLTTKPIVFKDKDGNEIIVARQGLDWNDMVNKVADLIDKGYEAALAVKEYLKSQDWFKSLNKDQQDAVIEQSVTNFETSIKEAEKGIKEFTKEVAKTIKDLSNNIDKLKQKVTDAKSRIESIKEQGKKIKEWINANRKELKGLTDAQFINLSKKLTNANLQSDINDVMDYINKMVSNADYNNKLSQAKKLNKDLKKLAKAESTLVNEKEALKRFTKTAPSSMWDADKLDEYNKFAQQLIESVSPAKNVKGEAERDTKTITTKEIDARAEKLAKEQEQDTFDRLMKNDMFEKIGDSWYWMGQGKPLTVDDIDEIKKELAIVNGKDIKESEAAIDRLNERAEFKEAMKQIVSVQIDKVRNLDRSQFSKEDNEILDRLKYIDVNKLDTKTLIQFNNVLNNIETNGDFSGAGRTIDVEAKLQEANPKLKSIVDKLNIFQFKNTTFWKTIRTKRSFDAIMQRLTLKDAVARAKMNVAMGDESLSANQVRVKKFVDTVNKAREEYIKKNKPSPKDVYSNGLVSRLIQNTGITEKEKAEQFAKRKEELKASIASLKDPKKATEEEQQLGKLIEEIYNELDLDNINNQKELIDKYSQVNKSGMDYILDMVDIYKVVREDFRRSQELYNNTTFDDIEYYTPTQNTTLSYKVSEKESIEGDSDYSGSEFGINTAMSKSSVKRVGMNKANQYMNLDFDNVISKKANDIANQAYTLGDRVFIDKLLKSEEFVETFGAKNAEVLKAAFKAKIDLILNKYPKQSDISKATNILNKISQLGAIRAIGGAFQSVKQSVVLVNTALELTTKGDGDLIGKAMIARYRSKSNGLGKLIEKSPIIMRETTKGGTAIPVDINEVTKTKIENEISRLQKLYGITEEKATQLATYLLKKGDIVPAEISWTAYYMQYLRNEKGVDVDNIDWDAEAANPDKEARAYAEGMVSDKQNVSNPANVSQMIASKEGFYQLMRNLVAPLSSFSFNVRNRLNDNIVALRYGGDRKAAVRDIIATSAELYAFQLLTQSIYAFVLKPGAEYVSEFFGFDPEKDPRDWEDILADITKRTAVFSAIADYLFTGTTIYGEEFGKRALNFIYSAYNKNIYEAEKYFSYSTEEMQQYNKDAQDYERTLPFRQKDISEVISGGGTMGVILGQGVNAFDALSYVYDDTQRMERSAEYNVKKGEYKPEIGRTVPLTEKEKNFFIISGLISAFGALVPVFSELNTINRMALRRGLRQSQTKYGKFSAKEGEEKKMTEFYTAYQRLSAEYDKINKDLRMPQREKNKILKDLGERLDRLEKQRAGGQEVRPNK